jgi:hypothetical protein
MQTGIPLRRHRGAAAAMLAVAFGTGWRQACGLTVKLRGRPEAPPKHRRRILYFPRRRRVTTRRSRTPPTIVRGHANDMLRGGDGSRKPPPSTPCHPLSTRRANRQSPMRIRHRLSVPSSFLQPDGRGSRVNASMRLSIRAATVRSSACSSLRAERAKTTVYSRTGSTFGGPALKQALDLR